MSSSTFIVLLFIAIAAATASSKEYAVGNTVGWRIPATNETELYTTWASRRRFHIGDTLRFRYSASSVVQVDKYGFYHCDSTHPITFNNDGNTVVVLDKVGTLYFISGSSERCYKGQKMIVVVNNVRHLPLAPAYAPRSPYYYSLSPLPSQPAFGFGSGAGPESGSAGLVSVSVKALVVALSGLGLCLVQA